jgi:tetratricopeptide (TPR) repeat protein
MPALRTLWRKEGSMLNRAEASMGPQRRAQHSTLPRIRLLILIGVGALTLLLGWLRLQPAAARPPAPTIEFAVAAQRTGAATDRQITELQSRLRAVPTDWQAYSQLGLAYLQKAREQGDPTYYQKSEQAFAHALDLAPDDYTAIAGMGTLALARHQFGAALVWGEKARQLNPARSYAYGVIADAQVELGRYAEAVDTLQTMVDLRPDVSAYTRISYLRELYGDSEGALAMMQQAVEAGGSTPETVAWTRTQLANLYFNQGNLPQAELAYRRALALLPHYVYALGGLGHVRAAQGRSEEAVRLLTQSIQIMPLPEFVILLGDLYAQMGQPQAAQRHYDLVRTLETLYRANGVDVDVEMALFQADHAAESGGQPPAATVALARQAYARRPSIHAADVLAWALYRAGRYEEAQRYAQQALRLGTQDALKWFHAGMTAYRLNDLAQAHQQLRRALAINPYFSIRHTGEARRIVAELDGMAPDE